MPESHRGFVTAVCFDFDRHRARDRRKAFRRMKTRLHKQVVVESREGRYGTAPVWNGNPASNGEMAMEFRVHSGQQLS